MGSQKIGIPSSNHQEITKKDLKKYYNHLLDIDKKYIHNIYIFLKNIICDKNIGYIGCLTKSLWL